MFQDHSGENDQAATWGASATIRRPVPEEFRDVAIARSEAVWGEIQTIDDGYVSWARSQGHDLDKLRNAIRASMLPSAQGGPGSLPHIQLADVPAMNSREPDPEPASNPFGALGTVDISQIGRRP